LVLQFQPLRGRELDAYTVAEQNEDRYQMSLAELAVERDISFAVPDVVLQTALQMIANNWNELV
jgi:hypothetical protein